MCEWALLRRCGDFMPSLFRRPGAWCTNRLYEEIHSFFFLLLKSLQQLLPMNLTLCALCDNSTPAPVPLPAQAVLRAPTAAAAASGLVRTAKQALIRSLAQAGE